MFTSSTKGLYLRGKKILKINIFGYSNNGLPGIEILGLGRKGRPLKEKFIYLFRSQNKTIPLKRFVLVIEGLESVKKMLWEDFRWLELPIYLLLCSLCKFIPIKKLDNCLSVGKVDIDGNIISLMLDAERNELFNANKIFFSRYMGKVSEVLLKEKKEIPLEEMFFYLPFHKISYRKWTEDFLN
ncbi:MAG: hypothetical protein VXW15_10890 [Bdellovibrionota bacterium]|nr:hypothetical protein [Bdellovibrionota bacterium]